MTVVVYGATYSVYTRIPRMALAIKAVDYQLQEIDIFDPETLPHDYPARHPFLKIPTLKHDGFELYETGAICRYIDETFPTPALFSKDAQTNARINQIISILDNYAYRCWVWDIAVERLERSPPDEEQIQSALPRARTCFDAINELAGDGPGLIGESVTFADVYGMAVIHYFMQTPEGRDMIVNYPRINAWWSRLNSETWVAATAPP